MSREAFRSAVDQLLEQAVEALVVIVPHESVLREAHSLGLDIPVVVVEGDLSETPLTAGVDNVQGARLATAHLLVARPRDRRAPVRARLGWAESHARRDGWRAELEAPGPPGPAAALGRRLERAQRLPHRAGRWRGRPTSPRCSWPTTRWRSA